MHMSTDVVLIDPEILGGTPVFKGTRVPIESLFAHLEKGVSIGEFLEDFPTVTREQVIRVLEIAEKATTSKDLKTLVG
ncbi:MAG: DUF433 domain-containing protein [Bacteroidetes bacterium]|nr:DUF433 domain-containing protein [Bacteroidota bacterium]